MRQAGGAKEADTQGSLQRGRHDGEAGTKHPTYTRELLAWVGQYLDRLYRLLRGWKKGGGARFTRKERLEP